MMSVIDVVVVLMEYLLIVIEYERILWKCFLKSGVVM